MWQIEKYSKPEYFIMMVPTIFCLNCSSPICNSGSTPFPTCANFSSVCCCFSIPGISILHGISHSCHYKLFCEAAEGKL
uniref:Uncharacterized protein n=1 Tax=Octopus bimaculoides TaxID=37653 RepID=A0A0L8FVB9_OCTBM